MQPVRAMASDTLYGEYHSAESARSARIISMIFHAAYQPGASERYAMKVCLCMVRFSVEVSRNVSRWIEDKKENTLIGGKAVAL